MTCRTRAIVPVHTPKSQPKSPAEFNKENDQMAAPDSRLLRQTEGKNRAIAMRSMQNKTKCFKAFISIAGYNPSTLG